MASIVQFAIWFFLLQKEDTGRVSSFLFQAPFFGVLSGWLLPMANEKLDISTLIGGSHILVGIYLVNRQKIWNRKTILDDGLSRVPHFGRFLYAKF
ncbi:EamA family transporter [Cytobacillus firmus]|uniref:EamA family transporter n=1 Tax=Bacillus sp. 22-7 TaxID=2709707 RepID=UPI0013CFC063